MAIPTPHPAVDTHHMFMPHHEDERKNLMPLRKLSVSRMTFIAVIAGSAALGAPAAASAAPCTELPTTKAFAQFGDVADYSPAPGGDFETGSWAIGRGAKLVSGNDPFNILRGTRSLSLGNPWFSGGVTAVSPEFCVDETKPHFRYMMKANGMVGALNTFIRFKDTSGRVTEQQVISRINTTLFPGKWKASELQPLSVAIPLLASGNGGQSATVQLVFKTAVSVLGSYQIDNVMVDPYRLR